MRQPVRVIGAVVAVAMLVGCGKSEHDKQVEEAAKQMEQAGKEMAKAGEDMAKAGQNLGQEMAKAGQEAGGDFAKAGQAFADAMKQMSGGKDAVDPVSFKALQTVLPTVSGWEMAKPTGERMTAPVPFSKTEADYSKGDSRITVEVTDSGFNKLVVAPFSMMMAAGYEKETESGYEKATKIGGNPAYEKWNADARNGEITVIVGDRFVVKFEGNDLADMKTLQAFVAGTDFQKLTSLK